MARWLALVLLAVLLAGCQSGRSPNSAWQLIQQQQQEQALARQSDEESKQRGPSEPGLMLSMISEAQSQGKYFASLAYIEVYLQKFGNDEQVSIMRADALRQTGQTEAAEQAYKSLLSTARADQGWHGLGLIAGARGEFGPAAENLARAAKLAPANPQILGDLGYARLRSGDSAGARVPLGQAAELAPDNPKTLANLALLLLIDGDVLRAQNLMEQARLSPEARNQVYLLAGQIQTDASTAAPAPNQMSRNDTLAMPMLRPVMDRLGNGPVLQ